MSLVVIDASALVEVLLQTENAVYVEEAVSRRELVAPSLIDIEVLSVLRRLSLHKQLGEKRARTAIEDLKSAPLERVHVTTFLEELWKLKARVSAYDAAYVALAKYLDTELLTTDQRLMRAKADRCVCLVRG